MWLVGTLLLIAVCVSVILSLGWRPRAEPCQPPWNIPGLTGVFTGMVGTIAGFSIASATIIAGLDGVRTSPAYATVIGMLLLAFLIFFFSALSFASTPAVTASGDATVQTLAHLLASLTACSGLFVSWLALAPLLDLLGLPALADSFTWLLLIVTLSGGGWVALYAYKLTLASARACLAIPILAFSLAALYRLVAARLLPSLWPATDAALRFAFVAFGLVGIYFAMHAALLLAHGNRAQSQWLAVAAHRITLACTAAYSPTMALLWFAIALP